MALSGNTLYAGGFFDYMGGQRRKSVAAVDATTGALTPFDPNPGSGWVDAIVVSGSTVYVGGSFSQMGGQPREGLAALDASTGTATAWNPRLGSWHEFYPRVMAIAISGPVLYAGGDFASVGGQPRICLAAVDTTTGAASDWDPGADGYVWALTAGGNVVYAGGGFTRLGGLPCSGLAGFSPPGWSTPGTSRHRALTFAPITPNPVRWGTTIHFALDAPSATDLAVYDVQGRRVTSILHQELLPAGEHEVPVRTDGWPAGFYICRMDAGGAAATRKMLVVK